MNIFWIGWSAVCGGLIAVAVLRFSERHVRDAIKILRVAENSQVRSTRNALFGEAIACLERARDLGVGHEPPARCPGPPFRTDPPFRSPEPLTEEDWQKALESVRKTIGERK